jgi:hypothetical protein
MHIRRLVLVAFMFAAQLVAGIHALEHFKGESDGHLPGQTCSVCLISHELTAALTTNVMPLPVSHASFALASVVLTGRDSLPATSPRQRGPPKA